MDTPYPIAEQVPWQPTDTQGLQTYWPGANKPLAAVLHIMQGHASTAREWANSGHQGASWHFTVSLDGSIMQHLSLSDAGFQAGIDTSKWPDPIWPLWQGPQTNVNWYTIGVEHEGFEGVPFTQPQAEASKALCLWLSQTLNFPFDRNHFPPHADIDLVNRANDFNIPALREAHYNYLFNTEEDMTKDETVALINSMRDLGQLASTTDVLSCIAQIVGAEPNTYSDVERITKVRMAIAALK